MWRQIVKYVPVKSKFKMVIRTNTSISSLKCDFEELVKHASIRNEQAHRFCQKFMELDGRQKEEIISFIATQYNLKLADVKKNAESFLTIPKDENKLLIMAAERIKQSLNPAYQNVFNIIVKLDHGIKFLIDLRSAVLKLQHKLDSNDPLYLPTKSLNSELKHLLAFAFSIGFLSLKRITWDSSCHMLQQISEYEAVHPVKNWSDIKQRVGPYRRCYVLTHSSMPKEPIVVLHTALTKDISSSINSIVNHKGTNSDVSNNIESIQTDREDPALINAAVFYSVTSTQKGLHGIELGNKLIKMVVGEILKEFPHISQLSSLSPIPGFRDWLLIELNKAKEGLSMLPNLLTQTEISSIHNAANIDENSNIWWHIGQVIATNSWFNDENIKEILRQPLLKLCAHYLYREKHRSYALNSVAHFHLRNGAVMWRLNWEADPSQRGLSNSCGIMVNYRYFMEETDANSQRYVENQIIKISKDIGSLLPHLKTKL